MGVERYLAGAEWQSTFKGEWVSLSSASTCRGCASVRGCASELAEAVGSLTRGHGSDCELPAPGAQSWSCELHQQMQGLPVLALTATCSVQLRLQCHSQGPCASQSPAQQMQAAGSSCLHLLCVRPTGTWPLPVVPSAPCGRAPGCTPLYMEWNAHSQGPHASRPPPEYLFRCRLLNAAGCTCCGRGCWRVGFGCSCTSTSWPSSRLLNTVNRDGMPIARGHELASHLLNGCRLLNAAGCTCCSRG